MPCEKEPDIPKEYLYSSKEFSICDLYDLIKRKRNMMKIYLEFRTFILLWLYPLPIFRTFFFLIRASPTSSAGS